jgi:hypothetical protein
LDSTAKEQKIVFKDPDEEMFESQFKRPTQQEIDDLFDGATPNTHIATNSTSKNDHSMEYHDVTSSPKKEVLAFNE